MTPRKTIFALVCILITHLIFAQKPSEFLHTYSIVARDSVSGRMGVAVQSHWFGVGAACPYVEAGVGAVATQSFVNATYGPRGLSLIKSGTSVDDVISQLTITDELKDYRQVGLINSKGEVAGHTGKSCVDEFCQIKGNNYIVQANMMLKKGVCTAMSVAFENTNGPLEERMYKALEAAQKAGGDVRGKQSAAIKIAEGVATGNPLKDTYMDIRVDDSRAPLRELKRLMNVHKAYRLMNASDEAMAMNQTENALRLLADAKKIQPRNIEIQFWTGVAHLNNNNINLAWSEFFPVFDRDKNWVTLLNRIKKAGLITADNATWNAIQGKIYHMAPKANSSVTKSRIPVVE